MLLLWEFIEKISINMFFKFLVTVDNTFLLVFVVIGLHLMIGNRKCCHGGKNWRSTMQHQLSSFGIMWWEYFSPISVMRKTLFWWYSYSSLLFTAVFQLVAHILCSHFLNDVSNVSSTFQFSIFSATLGM